MSTVEGTVKGIEIAKVAAHANDVDCCIVSFTLPAYTAASDNGQLTSLATELQNQRRDNKTVTLLDACQYASGSDGTSWFQTRSWAVSGGNLTFDLTNSAGSETNAASGVTHTPLRVLVTYTRA